MKIERAVREKTFTLTSIAGPSGSGKTYSAILYARGLVGPNGKIGFVDTENKRSRFYADVAGGFDVIDLDPPFTSARYIEAIKTFEDAGYKAIIVDSISHEWEGTGGVLEQADAIEQSTKRSGLHCWAKPKAGHKKLMNELLQTRAHLIFCCRVKEKVTQVKVNGKTEIVNEGFVVVQEKMFIYEMTVSMMLAEGTHVPTIQKCPGDLEFAFPAGKKITPEVGKSVAQWADQGVDIDQELEAAKREGLLAANNGMRALLEWWKALGPRQAKLEPMKDTFKSIATAADQLKEDINEAGGGSLRDSLAQARAEEAFQTREGFDQSFVARETAALTGGADSGQTEDNSQSLLPPIHSLMMNRAPRRKATTPVR
jgi:DNA polymerase III delta prime subunit